MIPYSDTFFCAYIDKFKDKVLPCPWEPRTIILSEGFAFCAFADALDVDIIIESGIYYGRSTKIWGGYFLPDKQVVAIDLKIQACAKDALRLKAITLIEGDSIQIIPQLLEQYLDKRVAIFLDGPKTFEAIALAHTAFCYKNTKMVAIHDTYQGTPQRKALNKYKDVFFTDDPEFVEAYKHLDIDESQLDKEQGLLWEPYTLKPRGDLGGSYAKTLAILLNTEKSTSC